MEMVEEPAWLFSAATRRRAPTGNVHRSLRVPVSRGGLGMCLAFRTPIGRDTARRRPRPRAAGETRCPASRSSPVEAPLNAARTAQRAARCPYLGKHGTGLVARQNGEV